MKWKSNKYCSKDLDACPAAAAGINLIWQKEVFQENITFANKYHLLTLAEERKRVCLCVDMTEALCREEEQEKKSILWLVYFLEMGFYLFYLFNFFFFAG